MNAAIVNRAFATIRRALANAGPMTDQQRKAMFARIGRGGGGGRTLPGRPSGSTRLPPNSTTTPIGEIIQKPEGPRGWGESRPGESYVQWEGPGNPSWEKRHPELNPANQQNQPPVLHEQQPQTPKNGPRGWGEETPDGIYYMWEGPGNPRWERQHPELNPANQSNQGKPAPQDPNAARPAVMPPNWRPNDPYMEPRGPNNPPPLNTGAQPIVPTPGRYFLHSTGLPEDRPRGWTPGIVPQQVGQAHAKGGTPVFQKPVDRIRQPPSNTTPGKPIDRIRQNQPQTIQYDPTLPPIPEAPGSSVKATRDWYALPKATNPAFAQMIARIQSRMNKLNQSKAGLP